MLCADTVGAVHCKMNKEQTTAEEMIRKGLEEATGGQT
jgi:hypothetical protein